MRTAIILAAVLIIMVLSAAGTDQKSTKVTELAECKLKLQKFAEERGYKLTFSDQPRNETSDDFEKIAHPVRLEYDMEFVSYQIELAAQRMNDTTIQKYLRDLASGNNTEGKIAFLETRRLPDFWQVSDERLPRFCYQVCENNRISICLPEYDPRADDMVIGCRDYALRLCYWECYLTRQ